jgi:hypothetical protein
MWDSSNFSTPKIMHRMRTRGSITVVQVKRYFRKILASAYKHSALSVPSCTEPLNHRRHLYYRHRCLIIISVLIHNLSIHTVVRILADRYINILIMVTYHQWSRILILHDIYSIVAIVALQVIKLVLMIHGVKGRAHQVNAVLLMRGYVMRIHCTI